MNLPFDQKSQAKSLFDSACKLLKHPTSTDTLKAAALLDDALTIDPKFWQARLLRAQLYESAGGSSQARQEITTVVAFHRLNQSLPMLYQYVEQEFGKPFGKSGNYLPGSWQEFVRILAENFTQKSDEEVRQIFDKVSAGLARTSSKEIMAKLQKISEKKWGEYDRQIEKDLNRNLELESAKRKLERPSPKRNREVSIIMAMPVALLLFFIKEKGGISWTIAILASVVIGLIAWKIWNAPKTAKKYLELAQTMMMDNSIQNPHQVATYLAKALKENPDLWQARLLRAQLYHSLGGILLAMKELTVVVGFHQLNHTTAEFNLYLKQEHTPLLPDDLQQFVQDLEKSFAQKEEGEIIKIMETEQAILDTKDPANILEDTRENQGTQSFEQTLKKPTKKYSPLKKILLWLGWFTPFLVLIIFKAFHIKPIQSEYGPAIGGIILLIWVILYYNVFRFFLGIRK